MTRWMTKYTTGKVRADTKITNNYENNNNNNNTLNITTVIWSNESK